MTATCAICIAAAPIVELHGIVKHFGAVQALRAWEAAAAHAGLSGPHPGGS